MPFNPPTVTDPASCTDAVWLYSAALSATSPDSPFPANFVLSVDQENTELSWGTSDAQTLTGYSASNSYGTY